MVLKSFDLSEYTYGMDKTSVTVCPTRGAIITSLVIAGKEILVPKTDRFFDLEKSTRSGVPLLFPMFGEGDNDENKKRGWDMKQHGFARSMPWILDEDTSNNNQVIMYLDSNSDTYCQFPFHFKLQLLLDISDDGVEINLQIENIGDKDMPVAPGFHPYLAIDERDKKKVIENIIGDQNLCYVVEKSVDTLNNPSIEESMDILHAGGTLFVSVKDGGVDFAVSGDNELKLKASKNLPYLAIWSEEKGSPFLCMEPIAGFDEKIYKDPVFIASGEKKIFSFTLSSNLQKDSIGV